MLDSLLQQFYSDYSEVVDAFDEDQYNRLINRAKEMLETGIGSNDKFNVTFRLCILLNDLAQRAQSNTSDQWNWVQDEIEQSIYYHRLLIDMPKFSSLNSEGKAQTYCNLANNLSWMGRFAGAIRIWRHIDNNFPNHPYVVVNWSKCLLSFCASLYDKTEIKGILCIARAQLAKFLRSNIQAYPEMLIAAESLLDEMEEFGLNHHILQGECIMNSDPVSIQKKIRPELDLNPLVECNIFKDYNYSGYTLDSYPYVDDVINRAISLFRSLRKDYLQSVEHFRKAHFLSQDENANTVDELSSSYKLAYSLYDKSALIVRSLFNLHPSADIRRINIRSVWFENLSITSGIIATSIQASEISRNWPLRGLYWLAKEVHIVDKNYSTLSPYSKKQADLRHYLEHRFVNVTDEELVCWDDVLQLQIGLLEFRNRTFQLLSNVREAIIYLCLALHRSLSQRLP